jgi:hypothetical protein
MNKTKGKRVRSGAWMWLRKGMVPVECEEIRLGVGRITADLAQQFCGGSKPTAAQLILIDRIGQMLGFCKLIEREAWRNGPIGTDERGNERLAPGLGGFYIAGSNGIAKALRELRELSERHENENPIDLSHYLPAKPSGTGTEGHPEIVDDTRLAESDVQQVSTLKN